MADVTSDCSLYFPVVFGSSLPVLFSMTSEQLPRGAEDQSKVLGFPPPISSCNLQVSCELLGASGHATVPPGRAFSSLPPRASCPASLCAKVSSAQGSLQRFSGDVLNSLVCIILLSRADSSAIPYCVHVSFEDMERVTHAGAVALLTAFLFWPYLILMLITRLSTNSGQLPSNTVSFPCLFFLSFLHGKGSPT